MADFWTAKFFKYQNKSSFFSITWNANSPKILVENSLTKRNSKKSNLKNWILAIFVRPDSGTSLNIKINFAWICQWICFFHSSPLNMDQLWSMSVRFWNGQTKMGNNFKKLSVHMLWWTHSNQIPIQSLKKHSGYD